MSKPVCAINKVNGIQREWVYFWHDPKVPKSLGPKPPKAEKPGNIPKIRKLATLKQYEFLNGIPPGFSPAERFFRQRPKRLRELRECRELPPYGGTPSVKQEVCGDFQSL